MLTNALKVSIIFFLQLLLKTAVGQPLFLIKPGKVLPEVSRNLKHSVAAVSSVTPPDISYETLQNYVLNQPVNPVVLPVNRGGEVPAVVYGQLSTLAGGMGIVTGVATDADGNVYMADWQQNQIKKITPSGAVTLFAGSISATSGTANGQGTAATFYEPDALIFDNSGNLYISDQGNNMIRKITPAGLVSTFAGNGSPGADNGTGSAARFNNPRGLAIDNAGNLYVADQGNNLIRKITPAGTVSTFAGSGASGFSNGTGLMATFNTPTAVAVDAGGNLYVADSGNDAIRKITPGGVVFTLAVGLRFPRELRVDGTGNIYVVEQEGYSLKRISPMGIVENVISGGLSNPIGLALDEKGNLFLGDGNSVKKVIISGYTIDKPLPAGLNFDPKTGSISGTPTTLYPPTLYVITAYNGGGSSRATVTIAVRPTAVLKPSIISLPPVPSDILDANNNYDPKATSTNHETPITYTSSNPAVAVVTAEGLIHVVGPGVTIITAQQEGNENYLPAVPVQQTLTVVQYLHVYLPDIAGKTVCDADFSANAATSEPAIPLSYSSSNPAVATISDEGIIHITGAGVTTITVSQYGSPPLYVSATPQSKTLTVQLPDLPEIAIAAQYAGACTGSAITFTANTNRGGSNPAYQWKVNGNDIGVQAETFSSSTLADGDMVTCTVTNTDNACVEGFPVNANPVKVSLITPAAPVVNISASINGAFPGIPVSVTAVVGNAFGAINYQWKVNGEDVGTNHPVYTSNTFTNGDIVTCTVTSSAECSFPATSLPLKINIISKLEIPNTFTPNGDGINDTWNILGIGNYPDCLIIIYNRYGRRIYQSAGYHQPWDGTINGNAAPVATYYYVIDLKDKKLKGPVTIIR